MQLGTILVVIAVATLAVAGCGSGGSGDASPTATAGQEQGVTAARAATWPTEWCESLHVGMNRTDAVEAMGEPVETFADQDQWQGFGYSFTAFYDETGTISQLDYDATGLTAAQHAKLTCEETRQDVTG